MFQHYWYNFLNQDTAFFVGADKIAKKTDHGGAISFLQKIEKRYYDWKFRPL